MSIINSIKEKAAKVPLWGWLAIGGGTLFLLSEGSGMTNVIGGTFDWAKGEAFKAALPTAAQKYGDEILQASREYNVSPALTYALGDRESGWGVYLSPKNDPGGTGDSGHGHGLMQIDDKTWGDWLSQNDWTDPLTNIRKGLDIFTTQMQTISDAYGGKIDPGVLARMAIVAYNHGVSGALKNAENGADYDTGTTGGNYSADVISKMDSLLSAIA